MLPHRCVYYGKKCLKLEEIRLLIQLNSVFLPIIYDTQNEWRERLLSVFVHFVLRAAFHIKKPAHGPKPAGGERKKKRGKRRGKAVGQQRGECDARHAALGVPEYLTPARRSRQETRLSTKGMFFSFWSRALRIFCPKRKDAGKTGVLIFFFGYFPFFAGKQCLPPLRTAAGDGAMKRRVYLALGV